MHQAPGPYHCCQAKHRTLFLTAVGACLLLLAAAWPAGAYAAPPAAPAPLLTPSAPGTALASYLEIFQDPSRSLTIAQVAAPAFAGRFRRMPPEANLKLGITPDAVWLRLRLRRPPASAPPFNQPDDWFIELDNTQIQYLDAFFPVPPAAGPNGPPAFREVHTGLSRPSQARPLPLRTFILQIPSEYQDGDYIYLRLASVNTLTMRLDLWSMRGLHQRMVGDSYFFGVVYGVLLAMLLSNLVFFFSLKDRTYLYYVFYVASLLLFSLATYTQLNLMLDLPQRLDQTLVWLFVGMVLCTAVLFARAFLRSWLLTPRLDKVLLGLLGAGGLIVVAAPLGFFRFTGLFSHILALAIPGMILATALASLRRGLLAPRFFLLGWSVLVLAVILFAAKGFGLAPEFLSGAVLLPGASALESLLLSFALAERVRVLRRQRQEARRREDHYREMSIRDELTGLYNKRYLGSCLQNEVERAMAQTEPLTMLLLDVDDFKRFNDTHGHDEGDKVLAGLATVVRERSRASDVACRYGGEEFVVIMPGTDQDQGWMVAERIRTGFNQLAFQSQEGGEVRVSVSIGLAQWQAGEGPVSLLRRADQALYRAKKAGKNRSEVQA
ncbi:MAG: GGDEF domain-containing protein [Desulfarculus sp.]|nr:MAG: GGDEF domain-containing protein [Desulfarculus sp.]